MVRASIRIATITHFTLHHECPMPSLDNWTALVDKPWTWTIFNYLAIYKMPSHLSDILCFALSKSIAWSRLDRKTKKNIERTVPAEFVWSSNLACQIRWLYIAAHWQLAVLLQWYCFPGISKKAGWKSKSSSSLDSRHITMELTIWRIMSVNDPGSSKSQ